MKTLIEKIKALRIYAVSSSCCPDCKSKNQRKIMFYNYCKNCKSIYIGQYDC